MTTINVPTYEDVSTANQAIFDNLKKGLGMVPNLYATMAHSQNALATYLSLQNAKSSIQGKAREVVNLVVSQVNECEYCLAAHTTIGKMVGFTEEQIMEIRSGKAGFDPKLDALAKFTKHVTEQRGNISPLALEAFLAAGWTKEHMVDVIVTIGDKIITNYLHGVTKVAIDFPAAKNIAA